MMNFPEKVSITHDSVNPSPGVLMIWCNRPGSRRFPTRRTDEAILLASRYHYVCPSDHVELELRGLSDAKDPRILLKRCRKCRTTWYGPTLSQLRLRPAGAPGSVD
jgi:hypothetical protein